METLKYKNRHEINEFVHKNTKTKVFGPNAKIGSEPAKKKMLL